jgi:hypothetical protein
MSATSSGFRILDEDNSRTSLFVYVVLVLAMAFTILALVLAILAVVKAEDQPLPGPPGPTGPSGDSPSFSDFEVPPIVYEGNNLVLTSGVNQFIVFNPNPPQAVTVTLPVASTESGRIWRFYNKSATPGLTVNVQPQDEIVGNINNPIQQDYVGFVISDGVTRWSINI